jgi:hypothetical protein
LSQQSLEGAANARPFERNVQATVVMEIGPAWKAEVAGERGAMVVSLALPLQVAHAQAMHENQQTSAGLREPSRQRGALERPSAWPPWRNVIGVAKRVVGRREVVAEHAVQRGDERLPLRIGRLRPDRDPASEPEGAGPSKASMLPPTTRTTPRTFL